MEADEVTPVLDANGNPMYRRARADETGGMGTTMFYIFGALLTAAAVVMLVTKKSMSVEA